MERFWFLQAQESEIALHKGVYFCKALCAFLFDRTAQLNNSFWETSVYNQYTPVYIQSIVYVKYKTPKNTHLFNRWKVATADASAFSCKPQLERNLPKQQKMQELEQSSVVTATHANMHWKEDANSPLGSPSQVENHRHHLLRNTREMKSD